MFDLEYVLGLVGGDSAYDDDERAVLGRAAKLTTKDSKLGPGRKGWFKSISKMEWVGEKVLGPYLKSADPALKKPISELFRQDNV